MRPHWVLWAALATTVVGIEAAHCEERTANERNHRTFAIETFVGRTYNYLDNMVDKDGLPYFNIFWTDPAEAAHDWPDFGDVTSRQLQAAIMARHLDRQGGPQREALDQEGAFVPRPQDGSADAARRPPSRSRRPTSETRPSRSMPW